YRLILDTKAAHTEAIRLLANESNNNRVCQSQYQYSG
ncbi:unnamed protein product, partial [marine sediment metagenome]